MKKTRLSEVFTIKEALPPGPQGRAPQPEFDRVPGKRPGTTKRSDKPTGWKVDVDNHKQDTGASANSELGAEELIAAAGALQQAGMRCNVEDLRNDPGGLDVALDDKDGMHTVKLADGSYLIVKTDYYDDTGYIISAEQAQQLRDEPMQIGGARQAKYGK